MFVDDRRTLRILTSDTHEYFAAANLAPNEGGMELRLCHTRGHVSEMEARICPEGMNMPEIIHVTLDRDGRLAKLASCSGQPPALNLDAGA
ncbi:MAG: hypothetical protein ACXWNK_00865 [Vulcanimicrobiaceae bacterium]